MSLIPLSLSNLRHLYLGKADQMFANQIQRAAEDCFSRPGDQTARKVTLEVSVTPVLPQDGDCNEAKVQLRCVASLPKFKTKEYTMALRRGGLLFSRDEDDYAQQSILEVPGVRPDEEKLSGSGDDA
jgi:hypothetical protein